MTEENISAIQKAWNKLGSGNLEVLEEIYSADIQFEDPISRGRGIENLRRHFGRLFRNLSRISYSYGSSTWTSDTLVMQWTLTAELAPSRKAFELPGISWLQLDPESGKIAKSREYFDLGKGLYEHVPILGILIKSIKRRIQAEAADIGGRL